MIFLCRLFFQEIRNRTFLNRPPHQPLQKTPPSTLPPSTWVETSCGSSKRLRTSCGVGINMHAETSAEKAFCWTKNELFSKGFGGSPKFWDKHTHIIYYIKRTKGFGFLWCLQKSPKLPLFCFKIPDPILTFHKVWKVRSTTLGNFQFHSVSISFSQKGPLGKNILQHLEFFVWSGMGFITLLHQSARLLWWGKSLDWWQRVCGNTNRSSSLFHHFWYQCLKCNVNLQCKLWWNVLSSAFRLNSACYWYAQQQRTRVKWNCNLHHSNVSEYSEIIFNRNKLNPF